jgi:hypothetical protein
MTDQLKQAALDLQHDDSSVPYDIYASRRENFMRAANPDAILALIAENERLTEQCKLFDAAAYKAKIEAQTLVASYAATQQEPFFWLNEQGQLYATQGDAERRSVGQKLIALYTHPAPQQAPANCMVARQAAYEALMREALKALQIRDTRLHDDCAAKLRARLGDAK